MKCNPVPFKYCLTLLLFCASFCLVAKKSKGQVLRDLHIVGFTDKNNSPFQLSNPSPYLSVRAIERRRKFKIPIDSTDLPITPAYLDSIRNAGGIILNQSKWMNQILVEIKTPEALQKINSFSFVRRVLLYSPKTTLPQPKTGPVPTEDSTDKEQSITDTNNYQSIEHQPTIFDKWAWLDELQEMQVQKGAAGSTPVYSPTPVLNTRMSNWDASLYGNSFQQIEMHAGSYLHNQGFTGEGMMIAILDAGFFGYKTNRMFDSLRLQNRVVMEWDFIRNEASVNEDHTHGMNCLGVLAANVPGVMVGSAPRAHYLLFRTENVSHEYPYEEQAWLAAAEKADSAGADMISSSLGYLNFDNPVFDYTYDKRDGKTALITQAANLAAKKGILVMNAAGNYGTQSTDKKYVLCPADGDLVFAVGAIQYNKSIASFSSWGPTVDGRTKPNAVSVGFQTYVTHPNGNAVPSNGTSFANPNLAGLMACLWQAYPEFSNLEIMRAVEKSSDRFLQPDERFGYGIPDFRKAALILENDRANLRFERLLGNQKMKAYPVPFPDWLRVTFKASNTGRANVRLLDSHGRMLMEKVLQTEANKIVTLEWQQLGHLPAGVYYLQLLDGQNKEMIPVLHQIR